MTTSVRPARAGDAAAIARIYNEGIEDRLADEVSALTRRLDTQEQLVRIARELSTLNESLQALAYAALGQQAPTVRRRRTG